MFAKLLEPKEYASVVGACIYISTTCRPDISHAVGRLSRTMYPPGLPGDYKLTYHNKHHPMTPLLNEYVAKDRDLFQLVVSNYIPW